MSEELLRGLIHTIYLTFSHNSIVFAYATGFAVSAGLSLWKPSRFTFLTLLGFLLLAVGFEYDKHLVGPLVRQTLESVVGDPGNYIRTTKLITIVLGEVVPVVFFVIGWLFVFLAMGEGARRSKKS